MINKLPVNFRASKEEKEIWEEAARKANMKFSEYVRHILNDASVKTLGKQYMGKLAIPDADTGTNTDKKEDVDFSKKENRTVSTTYSPEQFKYLKALADQYGIDLPAMQKKNVLDKKFIIYQPQFNYDRDYQEFLKILQQVRRELSTISGDELFCSEGCEDSEAFLTLKDCEQSLAEISKRFSEIKTILINTWGDVLRKNLVTVNRKKLIDDYESKQQLLEEKKAEYRKNLFETTVKTYFNWWNATQTNPTTEEKIFKRINNIETLTNDIKTISCFEIPEDRLSKDNTLLNVLIEWKKFLESEIKRSSDTEKRRENVKVAREIKRLKEILKLMKQVFPEFEQSFEDEDAQSSVLYKEQNVNLFMDYLEEPETKDQELLKDKLLKWREYLSNENKFINEVTNTTSEKKADDEHWLIELTDENYDDDEEDEEDYEVNMSNLPWLSEPETE